MVVLQGAAGPSSAHAFAQLVNEFSYKAPSNSLTATSSSELGYKVHLNSLVTKCHMIMADLKTTSVLLDELLSEDSWAKQAIELELSEL